MKLLLDQGLPRSAARLLQVQGVDTHHVADIGLSTASDIEILDRAGKDGSIIVTLDADFHALLAVGNMSSPSVIRIRIEGLNAASLCMLICRVLDTCRDDLMRGAAVSVQENRIGIKLLPIHR